MVSSAAISVKQRCQAVFPQAAPAVRPKQCRFAGPTRKRSRPSPGICARTQVTLGLAFSTPVLDLTNFRRDDAPIEQLSTRYHAIYEESYSLWGSLAIGLKLKSWLLLGASFNFGYTHAACRFCAMEMPKHATRSAAAAARANSGQVAPTSKWMSGRGCGFSAGAIVEPFWIGCGSAFRT